MFCFSVFVFFFFWRQRQCVRWLLFCLSAVLVGENNPKAHKWNGYNQLTVNSFYFCLCFCCCLLFVFFLLFHQSLLLFVLDALLCQFCLWTDRRTDWRTDSRQTARYNFLFSTSYDCLSRSPSPLPTLPRWATCSPNAISSPLPSSTLAQPLPHTLENWSKQAVDSRTSIRIWHMRNLHIWSLVN